MEHHAAAESEGMEELEEEEDGPPGDDDNEDPERPWCYCKKIQKLHFKARRTCTREVHARVHLRRVLRSMGGITRARAPPPPSAQRGVVGWRVGRVGR